MDIKHTLRYTIKKEKRRSTSACRVGFHLSIGWKQGHVFAV